MKRNRYLDKKTLEEARRVFFSRVAPFIETFRRERTHHVSVEDALHRITAEPIFARMSCPHYHAAAMDGLAVQADVTFGARESHPKRLGIGTDAHPVDTGNPLPHGTNAVIMIEDVYFVDDKTVEIEKAAYPWEHVRPVGEDLVVGEMILPENHLIRPYDMGSLLAGGVWTLSVRAKPRITVIPTGSELVEPGSFLKEGNIVNFNSTVLKGLITEDGADFVGSPILKDIYGTLQSGLLSALASSDVVLVIAGSSAGSHDFTATLLDDTGEVLVHGVTIMPGKPTILGIVQGKPVIGIPGYPVSAIVAYEQFVRPLISALLSTKEPQRKKVDAVPATNIPSKLGNEEFLRVRLGKVGPPMIATPLSRGSGLITSLSRADGIIRIPRLSEGLMEGEHVQAELLREEEAIENSIIMIGSHDLILDLLATQLNRRSPVFSLSSTHVGSMGGLLALQKGRAHLAGSHLFDPETGQYNVPYVKRILKGMKIHLVQLVHRQQGLILASGNPKRIKDVQDLTREGTVFINRQKGSGTRMLFDHLLQKHGLKPETIQGYEREEFTHMAVAVAVLSGSADAGVGIYAAAKALDLAFVPITMERYDLVIPGTFFHDEKIQTLLDTIRSEEFRQSVEHLGGYDVSGMGEPLPLR